VAARAADLALDAVILGREDKARRRRFLIRHGAEAARSPMSATTSSTCRCSAAPASPCPADAAEARGAVHRAVASGWRGAAREAVELVLARAAPGRPSRERAAASSGAQPPAGGPALVRRERARLPPPARRAGALA
jgi:3-deoxy-D-manno-octulosonate 8-phosphate phosphatase KdsC-like HAD superfamily phosphatase